MEANLNLEKQVKLFKLPVSVLKKSLFEGLQGTYCRGIFRTLQKQPLEVFYKKIVLGISQIGEHLCQSLFFNKVEGLRLRYRWLPEFCEISKNTFFAVHLWVTASYSVKHP